MKFNLRKTGNYCTTWIEEGNTQIDTGFLDHNEAKILLQQFKDAVDDLEWFVNSTEKFND